MNTSTPQLYLDFDDCLYNSHLLNGKVMELMVELSGLSLEKVKEAYQRSRHGGSTLEKHILEVGLTEEQGEQVKALRAKLASEGEKYLFDDVVEACKELSEIADLHLLSFGQSKNQFEKWNGVSVLHPYFKSVKIVGMEGKGIVFAELPQEAKELPTYFVDDKTHYLQDTNNQAPFVTTVQIIRFPEKQVADHPITINSLNELISLIKSSL